MAPMVATRLPEHERASFEDGLAAFRARDFHRAAALLLPVAGRGRRYRRLASRYLARMYAAGVGGLPRSPAAARYWRSVAGPSLLARVLDAARALALRTR